VVERRAAELMALGVEAIELDGGVELNGVRVLGKGTVGVVVLGHSGGSRVAIKVLRTDVSGSLEREARMLRLANSVGVGPKLLGHARDVIVREFIDGEPLVEFAAHASEAELLKVATELLRQAYALDSIGLSHKELARPKRHVIVRAGDLKPFIVDFSSATLSSRKRNLTQVAQYFFIRGEGCSLRLLRLADDREALRRELIEALRRYKADCSRDSFEAVIGVLRRHLPLPA